MLELNPALCVKSNFSMAVFVVMLSVSLTSCSVGAENSESHRPELNDSAEKNTFFLYSFGECLKAYQADKKDYDREKCRGENSGLVEQLRILKVGDASVPVAEVSTLEHYPDDEVEMVFVYIDGGPLARWQRIDEAEAFYSGLGQAQRVVFPIYPGTSYRSSGNGKTDLELGMQEIAIAVAQLRTSHPRAKVVIIGESWGSYFASRVELREDDVLVLLSAPILLTGDDLLEHFTRTTSARKKAVDTSFVGSIHDYTDRRPVNRYQYLTSALENIGQDQFVDLESVGWLDCSIIIAGHSDPILAGTDWRENLSRKDHLTQLEINAGHDLGVALDGFFERFQLDDCTVEL